MTCCGFNIQKSPLFLLSLSLCNFLYSLDFVSFTWKAQAKGFIGTFFLLLLLFSRISSLSRSLQTVSISFRIDYIWQLCVSTTSSSYSYDEEDDDGVSLRLLISVWILIVVCEIECGFICSCSDFFVLVGKAGK